MDKISHKLLDSGFFLCALGTTENAGGQQRTVEKGERLTYDSNNGALVVYDEVGRPWVSASNSEGAYETVSLRALRRGAYVPHSNDGGHFIHEVLPDLLASTT